jgi:hypothetical protein
LSKENISKGLALRRVSSGDPSIIYSDGFEMIPQSFKEMLMSPNMEIYLKKKKKQKHLVFQRIKDFLCKPRELETVCKTGAWTDFRQVVTRIWEPNPETELSQRLLLSFLCKPYTLCCGKGEKTESTYCCGWRNRL